MGNVRMLPWTVSESSPTTKPVSPYFPQSQAKSSNNGVPDFNDFRQLEDDDVAKPSIDEVARSSIILSTTMQLCRLVEV
jgi:hypothetical protein